MRTSRYRQITALMLILVLQPMFLFAQPVQDTASAWNLETLMESLSAIKKRQADYTETKTIALLDITLNQEGRLSFEAPDHLVKETLQPKPGLFKLQGDRLTITNHEGESREINLNENQPLQAFAGFMRGILAGDLNTLNQYFDLQLSGEPSNWHIDLKPKDRYLKVKIDHIEVQGALDQIHTLLVAEHGGDQTITRLTTTHD